MVRRWNRCCRSGCCVEVALGRRARAWYRAGAWCLDIASTRACGGRGGLPMAALRSKGLLLRLGSAVRLANEQNEPVNGASHWRAYGRRRAGASIAVLRIELHAPLQLLEQEGSFQSHLKYLAVYPYLPCPCCIVALLDLVDAPFQLNTFTVIGGLHRRGQWRVLGAAHSCLCTTWSAKVVFVASCSGALRRIEPCEQVSP